MRLFVAIELPEPLRERIARDLEIASQQLPAARWVSITHLHLTLSFMGQAEESAVARLEAGLAPVFRHRPPMSLKLSEAGAFPSRRAARVLWLGVTACEELLSLQTEVAECVATVLGAEPERRRFHPHVTLGRCRRPWGRQAVGKLVERYAGYAGVSFSADHGALIESVLGRGGARYRSVQTFPLAGEA